MLSNLWELEYYVREEYRKGLITPTATYELDYDHVFFILDKNKRVVYDINDDKAYYFSTGMLP